MPIEPFRPFDNMKHVIDNKKSIGSRIQNWGIFGIKCRSEGCIGNSFLMLQKGFSRMVAKSLLLPVTFASQANAIFEFLLSHTRLQPPYFGRQWYTNSLLLPPFAAMDRVSSSCHFSIRFHRISDVL